jgi:hypothetical protein
LASPLLKYKEVIHNYLYFLSYLHPIEANGSDLSFHHHESRVRPSFNLFIFHPEHGLTDQFAGVSRVKLLLSRLATLKDVGKRYGIADAQEWILDQNW